MLQFISNINGNLNEVSEHIETMDLDISDNTCFSQHNIRDDYTINEEYGNGNINSESKTIPIQDNQDRKYIDIYSNSRIQTSDGLNKSLIFNSFLLRHLLNQAVDLLILLKDEDISSILFTHPKNLFYSTSSK